MRGCTELGCCGTLAPAQQSPAVVHPASPKGASTCWVLRALNPPRRAAEDPRCQRRVSGDSCPKLLALTPPLQALGFRWSHSGSWPDGHNVVEGRRNSFVLPKASQLIKFLFPHGPALPTPSAPGSFCHHAGVQPPCAYHKSLFQFHMSRENQKMKLKSKETSLPQHAPAWMAFRV